MANKRRLLDEQGICSRIVSEVMPEVYKPVDRQESVYEQDIRAMRDQTMTVCTATSIDSDLKTYLCKFQSM